MSEKMTQYERMLAGMLYDPEDPEIRKMQTPYQDGLWEFNRLRPSEQEKRETYMKTVFASCGDGCYIEPPLHANWGGHHVHMGDRVYANSDLTLVDDGQIFIGDHVLIGPMVTIVTAGHPVEPDLRRKGWQFNRDVVIGNNVWIGAQAVILPGVKIGENSVIGAGSVVTKDIPANVVAVGNPCRVLREIGDRDREYFYKNDIIDPDAGK